MKFEEQQLNSAEHIKPPEAVPIKSVENIVEEKKDPVTFSEEIMDAEALEQSDFESRRDAELARFDTMGVGAEKAGEIKFNFKDKFDSISQRVKDLAANAKGRIMSVMKSEEANQIVDSLPVVGGTKRIIESAQGETLSGRQLDGSERVIHGAKGAIDLGLDLSGIGEVEKGAKLAYVGKKVADGLIDNKDNIKSLGKKVIENQTETAQTQTGGIKQEATVDSKKESRYAEKITNPELIQAISENSKIVNAELDEFNKNVAEKLSVRAEKLKQREEELRAYISGKGETLRNKRHLQEEITSQELRVSGSEQKIKNGEQRLESLDAEIPPTSRLRSVFEKLRGPKKQEVDFMQESEKRKLESLNANLSQANEKLDTVYSAKNVDTVLESAFNEWQKSLSYETMTEDNPEYKEKMDSVIEKYLDLYEERELQKEGIDKETIREEFSQIAGDLVYGKQNGKQFNPIRNKETKDLPSMEANAFAMGIKGEDVDKLLAVQAKLNGVMGQNDLYDKKDFEIARHRTYYEARRTAENVFTHVIHPDAIEAVMKSHSLKSSLKFRTEGGERNSNVADTAEENVFLTSGGGGYKNYGGKNFAFFATTGQNILESGKSISVASPSLKEQGEYGKGRELGEYESASGAEMPIDDMVFVTRESQIPKYLEMFKQNGYSQEWMDSHVVSIPEDVVKKMEAIENPEEADSMLRKEFINKKLKGALKNGKSEESLYLTTASRTPKHGGDGRIYKWEKTN